MGSVLRCCCGCCCCFRSCCYCCFPEPCLRSLAVVLDASLAGAAWAVLAPELRPFGLALLASIPALLLHFARLPWLASFAYGVAFASKAVAAWVIGRTVVDAARDVQPIDAAWAVARAHDWDARAHAHASAIALALALAAIFDALDLCQEPRGRCGRERVPDGLNAP